MHDRGIYFRDLSGGNILVQQDDGKLRVKLIDTARTRVFTKGLPRHRRLSDLTRATHKLNAAGRETLLQHYFNTHGKPLAACHRPAHWSQLVIGTMEPRRDRHIEATPGSAHRSQRRIGIMEPVLF